MIRFILILFIAAGTIFAAPPIITSGSEAPDPNLCHVSATGTLYVRSQDPANGPIQTLRCTQTGPSVYAWQPISHFVGATLPAKCAEGDFAFRTSVGLYVCSSANAWVKVPALDSSGNLTIGAAVPVSATTITPDQGINYNGVLSANLDTGLRSWRVLSQAARTGVVNVIVLGDSITEGYAATDRFSTSWVPRLRDYLQSHYGGGGEGMIPTWLSSRWTRAGTWSSTNAGPHGYMFAATGTANTQTVTGVYCDNFDVGYLQSSDTATFQVSIDGGEWTDVVAANGSAYATVNVATTLGTHTIALRPTATGHLFLWGLSANVGTTGMRVHNFGKASAVLNDVAANAARLNWMAALAPALTIVALDVNDYSRQSSLSTYQADWDRLLAQQYAANKSVLVLGESPDGEAVKAVPQSTYQATGLARALANGAAWATLYNRWGTPGTARILGYLDTDAVHPLDSGHADWAETVASIILTHNARPNSGSPGKAACWKADGKSMGYCSTTPTDGACTCN